MIIAVEELLEHPVRFNEVFEPGHIDYATGDLTQVAGLNVRGTASLLDKEIHLRGRLGTEIEVICARCLDPIRQAVEREFDLFYHPLEDCPREDELQVPPGEEELGFYRDGALLLEDVAREQVLLTLPMRSICREDCRGLCVQCGCNLNREPCSCPRKEIDPRWEGLLS